LHHPTPKFVTTVHFQPLKMQRDAAEDLFGRRHRSTHVANQKSLSQVAINHPPHFYKKSEHNNQMDGNGDEMAVRQWRWKIVGRIVGIQRRRWVVVGYCSGGVWRWRRR
jgi:hypothetical protein